MLIIRQRLRKRKKCFNLKDIGVDLSESNITEEQREKAKVEFEKWQNLFSRGPTALGHTDLVRHEIHLTDETHFKEPFRRISDALYNEVRDHIKRDVSCRCNTIFAASILLKCSSYAEKGWKHTIMH